MPVAAGANPKSVFRHPPAKAPFDGKKWLVDEWTGQLFMEGYTINTSVDTAKLDCWGAFVNDKSLYRALDVVKRGDPKHPLLQALGGNEPLVAYVHADDIPAAKRSAVVQTTAAVESNPKPVRVPSTTTPRRHAFIVRRNNGNVGVEYASRIKDFESARASFGAVPEVTAKSRNWTNITPDEGLVDGLVTEVYADDGTVTAANAPATIYLTSSPVYLQGFIDAKGAMEADEKLRRDLRTAQLTRGKKRNYDQVDMPALVALAA